MNLTEEQISDLRLNVAIERFSSFDEYMEIPGYTKYEEFEEPHFPDIDPELAEYRNNLEKRFQACKLRYQGMEEHMEIPDMDHWTRLKEEILEKTLLRQQQKQKYYYYITTNALRHNSF